MTVIREFVKVHNHQLSITLPADFDYDEVEVVILPRIVCDDLSSLTHEVEKGFSSPLSNKSHNEIFEAIRAEYDN
ncbi:MAG: hypothetical protein K6347_02070 [Campylobacterales bacterium]